MVYLSDHPVGIAVCTFDIEKLWQFCVLFMTDLAIGTINIGGFGDRAGEKANVWGGQANNYA